MQSLVRSDGIWIQDLIWRLNGQFWINDESEQRVGSDFFQSLVHLRTSCDIQGASKSMSDSRIQILGVIQGTSS